MQPDNRPSYGFELYERSVARRCLQVLTKKYGPSDQIEGIWIVRDPGSYWPDNILVRYKGLTGEEDEEMLLQPSRAGSDIPDEAGDADLPRDHMVAAFPEISSRFDLNSDEKVPGLLLAIARARSCTMLRKELAEAGYRVPVIDRIAHCTYQDAGESMNAPSEELLWKKVEVELQFLPGSQLFLAELASVCYAGIPDRLSFLAWTESLAGR